MRFKMDGMRVIALFILGLSVWGACQQLTPAAELVRQFKADRLFWRQFEVARRLVQMHDDAVLSQLEPYLNDEDRHVRGNAAFVFAALGYDRGFEVIAQILKDRSDRSEGQGKPGGNWSVATQIASDRYYAVHLLGDLKNPRAVPILIPLLSDHEVSSIVPWSLGNIGDKSAVPALIQTLDDPSPDMRVLAIDALETLKAKDALPRLLFLLNDKATTHFDQMLTVAQAASEAVKKLKALPEPSQ